MTKIGFHSAIANFLMPCKRGNIKRRVAELRKPAQQLNSKITKEKFGKSKKKYKGK